jgi:hypothetical protein
MNDAVKRKVKDIDTKVGKWNNALIISSNFPVNKTDLENKEF